ncbi:MAG: aminoacetone oxidase family FAD-binding enzyme, partial [Clostridia bacterium]|nr:aminoacetone oxidase family FAD-binding enzyme [Clostridia bacterium]
MIDVIVVGAGAAGMMAAGTSAERGLKTVLFERNEKPGRKIMITGKGRCNVTNDCNEINELVKNVPVNGKFLFSAFSDFMPEDTIRFFEERNVRLKTERGKRVFPLSDKSSDIVDCLKNYVLKNKVEIKNQRIKKIIIENNKAIGVETIEGKCFYANNIIIATGGKSYPQTGSTGDGYVMA